VRVNWDWSRRQQVRWRCACALSCDVTHPSSVEGAFVNFLCFGWEVFRTACCLTVLESPSHRDSLNMATEPIIWLSYVRFERFDGGGCAGCFVFWDAMLRIFETNMLPPSWCYKMAAACSTYIPVSICHKARHSVP
jgi:hypothetical protein